MDGRRLAKAGAVRALIVVKAPAAAMKTPPREAADGGRGGDPLCATWSKGTRYR